MPYASVIIPTTVRTESLNDCLYSLSKQSFKDFEVVIIYRDSKDSLISSLKDFFGKFPIIIEEQKEKGLVSARNQGWRSANGSVVCFIDDDVTLSENWLKEVAETFKSSGEIAGVSGPTMIPKENLDNRDLINFHTTIKEKNFFWKVFYKIYAAIILENNPLAIGKIFKSGANSIGSNFQGCLHLNSNIEVDYLEACNMSYRRDILEKTAGFNNIYTETGDWCEPDLSFRIKNLGYKLLFNPKAVVFHKISKLRSQKNLTHAGERMANFVYFYLKCVRLNSFEKFIRFGCNLIFINSYYFYKCIVTKNINWLTSFVGTIKGFILYFTNA